MIEGDRLFPVQIRCGFEAFDLFHIDQVGFALDVIKDDQVFKKADRPACEMKIRLSLDGYLAGKYHMLVP